MTEQDWITYASLALGLCAAQVGGVFQSFSDFVMRGLLSAAPTSGMESMQAINRTVMRSVFLISFMALAPATVGFAILISSRLGGSERVLIIAAAVLYVTTVFLVTLASNVPMNNRLAAMDNASPQAGGYWQTYGKVWTRWNHVRTIGSYTVASLYLMAAILISSA